MSTEWLKRIGRKDIDCIAYSFEMFFEEMQKNHGVAFRIGRRKYDNRDQGSFVVEVSTIAEDGEANTPEAEAYRQECRGEKMAARLAGVDGEDIPAEAVMQEDWLGQTLKAGDEFTLLGWKSKARKRPVLVRRKDGSLFVWTREFLLQIAAANPPQER